MADTKFTINIKFEGASDKEKPPDTFIYAFDAKGNFLASAPLAKETVALSLPPESTRQAVRLILGPSLEKDMQPTVTLLQRYSPFEERRLLDPKNPKLQFIIPGPIWKRWPICHCVVRGRVVIRQVQPNGTVKYLPVCHSRVTICEVDALPFIILRLPDPILLRLRDEVIKEFSRPIRPLPVVPSSPEDIGSAQDSGAEMEATTESESGAPDISSLDLNTQIHIRALATTKSVPEIKQRLTDLHLYIRPFLCRWPWIYPFFFTRVDCLRTVDVDENGRFQTVIPYLCIGDKPDLYFRVAQLQGGVWKSIYKPTVACHTHWNYNCGSEVTIVITDPSAIACVPQDPVVTGEATWVMPYAVGGSLIWGRPSPPAAAPNGWVRSDGFTNYGGITDAPFGNVTDGSIGFRMGYSNNITGSATIRYFRWSYRKVGTTDWSNMTLPVSRHYVKTVPAVPAPIISFPTFPLGLHTVGTTENLFRFKPATPPAPTIPPDPAGTTTAWPVDNWFDDIYAAFLNTQTLPGGVAAAAGQYQIKLEIFGPTGALIAPGAGTFQFIVPSSVDPDGTVHTRLATPAEIDAGGFVFNLQIDNNRCTAVIYPTAAGASAVADACGFLRYTPGITPITLAFTASHPNNRATFSFSVVRGMTPVGAANVNGAEVGSNAPPYTRDASSRFSNPFAQAALLGTCVNAAFAESLYVSAKVTNGWGRIGSGFDASALAAFALATP